MKSTIKLLIAFIVVLTMVCVVSACDFGGKSCDHEFVEISYEAGCVDSGEKRLECSKCGYPKREKVPAVGHDIEVIEAVEPTCTTSGMTEGEKCKICGEYVVYPEEIPPQHKIETVEGKPATCTEDGMTDGKYCSLCNMVIEPQTTIYADHDFQIIVAIEPTCTEDGWSEGEKCTKCGITLREPQKIPAGHNLEFVPAVDKTCDTDGCTEGYKCTRCDFVSSGLEVIPAEHTPEIVAYGYPATCTSKGLSDETACSMCGETLSTQEVIPVTDHSRKLIPGYAATCTSEGLKNGYECKVCGNVLVEQEIIPMTAHVATTIKGYDATCSSVGLSDGEACESCGLIMKNQYTLLSDGHQFDSDGCCVGCGITVTAELEYELVDSSVYARSATRYVVSGLQDGATPSLIVIPETYEGSPVVGIKAGAFQDAVSITKVIVPKTIEMVGENAFAGCVNLEVVECSDFTQTATWDFNWYGDADVKITAIFNQGKTPYETYVEAMNAVGHNYDNYTLTSTSNAYYTYEGVTAPMLTMHITQQQAGKNFLQWSTEEGVAGYDSISGYVNGYWYSKDENTPLYKIPVSYEYWIHQNTVSAASIEMGPEDFNGVEFYMDVDGTMHLTLDFCSDSLMEMIESLTSSGVFGGLTITSSKYDYVFDANGVIKYYEYNVDMSEVLYFAGRSEFTNIGSTVINESVIYDYTYVPVTSCTSGHTVVEVEQIDATCYGQGRSAYSYCSKCFEAITYMSPIEPAHSFENGECTVCGTFEDSNMSTGLAYAINDDRTGYILVGLGECKDTDVYVPTHIYGLPVIAVMGDAFSETAVENITIGGVTTPIDEFIGWTK